MPFIFLFFFYFFFEKLERLNSVKTAEMVHAISVLTTVSTVSRWPSPENIHAQGCCECFGFRDHIRIVESADAEANKVGSTGEILRSITSYKTTN